MDALAIILGLLLIMAVIIVPIMTFTNSSRITKLHEKVAQLEKRIQQQGITLKELYETVEQEAQREAPFEALYEQSDEDEPQAIIEEAVMPAKEEGLLVKPVWMPASQNNRGSHAELVVQAAAVDISSAMISTEEQEKTEHIEQKETEETPPATVQMNATGKAAQTLQQEQQAVEKAVHEQKKEHASSGKSWRDKRLVGQKYVQPASSTSNQCTSKHSLIIGFLNNALHYAKQWFKTGNMPVKVGILVLFAGVASLLNYATNQGWVSVSMQTKLASIAVLSVGAFVFAWRKRKTHRTFSLNLQGGAIGILQIGRAHV